MSLVVLYKGDICIIFGLIILEDGYYAYELKEKKKTVLHAENFIIGISGRITFKQINRSKYNFYGSFLLWETVAKDWNPVQ